MAWSGRWYKRRLPYIGWVPMPAPPRQLVLPPRVFQVRGGPGRGGAVFIRPPLRAPAANVAGGVLPPRVFRQDFWRRGSFVAIHPPWKAVTPPRILPPTVARADFVRRGVAYWLRPPLKPVVNVGGKLLPPLVVRFELLSRWRPGQFRRWGWLSVPSVPFAPALRVWWLRASPGNVFQLRAGVHTVWNLRASQTMSVPANISFFQGEDIQLNFALVLPADITGWTLTGTVQNKLGGSTQFTFTPSIQDAGRGWIQVSWPRAQTSALTPGDYVWDVRRTDAGKNVVLAHGEATVKQPVTP